MDPVSKALWYIESHFSEPLSLDSVASVADVSRFHLSRAFSASVGQSVSAYIRGRRLTEAARKLVQGAPDILSLALDAGYGSHEAFSRAFKIQFGMTPEAVRDRAHLSNLKLVEPMRMMQKSISPINPIRFEDRGAFMFAGVNRRYQSSTMAGIPSQWQSFQPHIGHLPEQKGDDAFGICHNFDEESGFDYMCAVEVEGACDLPEGLSFLRVAPARYAVFQHMSHVASIGATMQQIWNGWLPDSGHRAADAPLFERYSSSFDPATGNGGFEIWIALAP